MRADRSDARGGLAGAGCRAAAVAGAVAVAFVVSGCGENGQSTLSPHSPQSREISTLWWWMLGAAWVVLGGTCVLLLMSFIRRRREGLPWLRTDEGVNTRLVIGFGVVIPVVCLVTLFALANFEVGRATGAPPPGTTKLTIHVVGRQWFWEFRYPGSSAVVANEFHIPVRTRVRAVVTTADVIHSFWVPELNRKIDAVPGRANSIVLYADHAGTYRGQCAEFCGLQHAHMSLLVHADPPAAFRAWLAEQAAEARAPAGELAQQGERAFMANACASCHTIRGTEANGQIGPDLTHVASRTTLAALTIPNDDQHLLDWISDPQHVKPGAKMPGLDLSDADFRAIAAYLEGLR